MDESASPAARPRPAPAHDRAARRHKVFEPARLLAVGAEQRVHILNISATGALLHAGKAPARGTRVTVEVGAISIGARIAWADGARCGVAFDRPLDAAALSAIVSA